MKEKFIKINTIEGYENIKDCYWISNTDEDKIVNRNTGKKLKSWIDHYGYPTVKLSPQFSLFLIVIPLKLYLAVKLKFLQFSI